MNNKSNCKAYNYIFNSYGNDSQLSLIFISSYNFEIRCGSLCIYSFNPHLMMCLLTDF